MMDVARIEVRPVEYTELKGLRDLVGSSGNLPFQYHTSLDRERLADYHHKKTLDAVSGGKVDVFGATVEDKPLGLLLLAPLPWDNEVLGISCFSIQDVIVPEGQAQDEITDALVAFAVGKCRDEGGDLLVAKTDPVAQHLVRALGLARFEHMSTLIFYSFDVKRSSLPPVPKDFVYRPFEEADIPAIEEVAEKGFAVHFDRYTLDRRIPRDRARNVHREWVKNSCRGYADQVFVALDGGRIIAFGTWKFEKSTYDSLGVRIARYDLGAVLPEYRSRGVFKGMTAAGMQWIGGRADIIEGPTNIRNYPTQRALTSMGWRIVGSRYNYHLWLKQ